MTPDREVAVLLTAGHVEIERVGHLLRPLGMPVGAGFFEMADAVFLEEAADLDRLPRRVAAVAIHQESRVWPHRLAHRGHDCLGAAGPFVLVVPAFPPDAELECRVTVGVALAQEALRLRFRRDVALHTGGVDRKEARLAAQELADALALELATEIPERGVEAGDRAK